MTRRHAGLWAGAVLGALLVGCGTFQPEPETSDVVSKACLSDGRFIGPTGGTLSAGVYSLHIPAGALSSTVEITMNQENCGHWPVRLGPEGLQFTIPATLEFNASGEPHPDRMTVAWWNPSTSSWVDQETRRSDTVVLTDISHFSRYTIH